MCSFCEQLGQNEPRIAQISGSTVMYTVDNLSVEMPLHMCADLVLC